MYKNPNEKLDIENFSKKETYSAEEKQFIMDRLNEERLISQRIEVELTSKLKEYTEDEKNKILQILNENRLTKQKREEITKNRTYKKEKYNFGSKEFYKFTKMEREYYIAVEDCKKLSSRPAIFPLYYRSITELKKKDVLIKTEIYSDKFFISYDAIRVYYKAYSLEDEKKK
ncbi:MAG: hypothetical protein OQK45_08445 [Sulfurovum sp.]|nr:hypothetical protein [Sulfurovum sp.]